MCALCSRVLQLIRKVVTAACALSMASLLSTAYAQNGTAPDVKHMALIIGNGDYNLDGKLKTGPNDTPPPNYLVDLANPCRDATLFRDKLLAAHWRLDEIVFPACNLRTAEMRVLITDFRAKLSNSVNTVAIFYYSGHGAQFTSGDTSHSFLFGVGAKLDLVAVGNSLIHSPGNSSAIANEAVDLDELVRTIGRQTENAVLIILDACRDNPLYGQLAALDNAPAITALSSNSEEFTGIVIAYSTSAGHFSGDGFGSHSIYTSALSSLLDPPRNLDSVLNKLRTAVAREYKKAYPNRIGIQEPVTHGRFTGDWCVLACIPTPDLVPVAAQPLVTPIADRKGPPEGIIVPPASALLRVSFQVPPVENSAGKLIVSGSLTPASQTQSTSGATPAIRTIYDASTSGEAQAIRSSSGMRFDVFWCDGGVGSDEREHRAAEIASALSHEAIARQLDAQPASSEAGLPAGQFIASVRLRRLTATANTASGYRYSDDWIVYDKNDVNELAWSNFASRAVGGSLKPYPDTAKTPEYISIFVCRAPEQQTNLKTVIYLQVPTNQLKQPGRILLEELTYQVPTVKSAGGIETRGDGPFHTEVRFYDEEERNNAFATANVLEKLLNRPVRVQFIPRLASASTLGHMEIWLGRSDPPLSENGRGTPNPAKTPPH